jgi:hypothetical protein
LGAVHVFRHTGDDWAWDGRFAPADLQHNDAFGYAVALSGDRFVAGAYSHDFRGAAYVFAGGMGGWTEETKLTPDDGFVGQFFGVDVDIDAGTALVGCYAYDGGCDCPLPGSAYVFTLQAGAWVQESKLLPSDGKDEEFGVHVALEGDIALVGNRMDRSAYLYEKGPDGWDELAKLAPQGLNRVRDVDLGGRRAVLGAASGPVFLYQLCDPACYADLDGSGDLTLFDFLEFVNLFNAADDGADCDGSGARDLFDFLCFVNAFNAGCE